MRLGIGVGVGRQRFAGGFADSYSARVLADGGAIESLSCVANASTLLQQASLLFIPSGYKAGVAYSALPNNGNGDLTWTRNSTANRTLANGNIGSVGANVPRLSYMYGSCPSALLEPQRTNSIPNSLGGGTGYDTVGTVTVTNNFATAPDGTTTATRVNASAGVWRYRNNNTTSLLANTTYTFSVWVKSNTSGNQTFRMYLYNATFSNDFVATPTWQRFTFTLISPASVTQIHGLGSDTLNSAADILTWGWQIESGSYSTTYIPTTTATATRLADTFTRNNIYTNGLISSSGGTWYVELKNNVPYLRDNGNALFIGDTTFGSTNAFNISVVSGTQRLVIYKRVSGAFTSLRTTASDNVKIAIKWNGTTADVFENGVKVVSATAFPTTLMEFLYGQQGVPVFIQAMALYNTPLSDSECIALTT